MSWENTSAQKGWDPTSTEEMASSCPRDWCITVNEKIIWSRTDLNGCETALPMPSQKSGATGPQWSGTNPKAGPAMLHCCYFKCPRTARKKGWLRNKRNQHVCARKPAGPTGAALQQFLSLPAALPVIYMSVTDTRIGSCIFKHRLLTSRCSHSLSLLEDCQNSLSEFYFHFSFFPLFAVCISLSLVRDILSKRGALPLSHSNAPRVLDQRTTIDHAVSEYHRSWISNNR